MKNLIKTHKIQTKIGFIEIVSYWNPILVPCTWIGMQDDSMWVKSLTDPQYVCMEPIEPMKTHWKTHKIGPKFSFITILSHQTPIFGPKHIDWDVG